MSTVVQEPSSEIIPAGDGLFEIVDGRAVEKSMGVVETHVTNRIGLFLGRYVFDNDLGLVEPEMLFDFGIEGQPQRRPDVAFISHDRWPRDKELPSRNALQVVPDLVVEVVSPSNSASEVETKILEYFRAGVRLIWVVHPTFARIYIHDSPTTIKVVSGDVEIDGGDVLPGFRLPLSNVFRTVSKMV